MARGRMISKSLSTSEKFAALVDTAGPLAEFCQLLYPLIVPHTDDYGRLQGDPFTVKHVVHPSSTRTLAEFRSALQQLADVKLITWYVVDRKQYIQVEHFDRHQQGLHKRTSSIFPPPNGATSTLDASEKEITDWIATLVREHVIVFSGLTVTSVQREVRRDNKYIDILCTTREGPPIVIEVKRLRVTRAAIAQVLKYCELLGDADAVPVVIGYGLAVTKIDKRVAVMTYDDARQLRAVSSANVKSRQITISLLTDVPGKEKRTEEKRTEEKYPPTPQGGRARRRRHDIPTSGRTCQHDPRCRTYAECTQRTLSDGRSAKATPTAKTRAAS